MLYKVKIDALISNKNGHTRINKTLESRILDYTTTNNNNNNYIIYTFSGGRQFYQLFYLILVCPDCDNYVVPTMYTGGIDLGRSSIWDIFYIWR